MEGRPTMGWAARVIEEAHIQLKLTSLAHKRCHLQCSRHSLSAGMPKEMQVRHLLQGTSLLSPKAGEGELSCG